MYCKIPGPSSLRACCRRAASQLQRLQRPHTHSRDQDWRRYDDTGSRRRIRPRQDGFGHVEGSRLHPHQGFRPGPAVWRETAWSGNKGEVPQGGVPLVDWPSTAATPRKRQSGFNILLMHLLGCKGDLPQRVRRAARIETPASPNVVTFFKVGEEFGHLSNYHESKVRVPLVGLMQGVDQVSLCTSSTIFCDEHPIHQGTRVLLSISVNGLRTNCTC